MERYRAGKDAAENIANGSEHEDDKKAVDAGKWWLHEPALIAVTADIQAEFMEQDAWHDTVLSFIKDKSSVSIDDVLAYIGVFIQDREQRHANRAARILLMLGWTRKQQQTDGKRTWMYFAPEVHR